LQSSAGDDSSDAETHSAFRCSESSPELQGLADKFAQLLSAGVYPETFLVGVSVLLRELTSLCGGDSDCIQCSLTVIMNREPIRRAAESLRDSEEKISSLIDSNPIFEVLKSYKQLILGFISGSPQRREVSLQTPITVIREDRGGRVVLQKQHLGFMLEPYIKRLESELSYARSMEWYLTKLSSLVTELKDLCQFLQGFFEVSSSTCVEDMLKTVLNDERVKTHMVQLKYSAKWLLEDIERDPRFGNLRPYRALLSSYLASLPPPPPRPRREEPLRVVKLHEPEEEEEMHTPVYKSERLAPTTYEHFEPEEPRLAERSAKRSSAESETIERKPKFTNVFPKVLVALYILLLLANVYVFATVPWVTYRGKQYVWQGFNIYAREVNASLTGWDVTRFFLDLHQLLGARIPIFIAYLAGLVLAVIALVSVSPTLSAASGVSMLIGWYHFCTSATLYEFYVRLVSLLGFIEIESGELREGALYAGFLAFLQLALGTYLVYKVKHR